jgi:transcriptional regulator with XRE-family HTH domain
MLADVLFRIQKRLEKVGLSESRAAIAAGLSQDAIRNMRRTVESGKLGAGVNTSTIAALAPVLQTTVSWLLEERGSEELSDDYIDAPTVIDVPLISWESAAKLGISGAPILAQDMSRVVRVVDLDIQGNWIALRVSGNVMNLVSPHDSIIFRQSP